MGTQPCANCGDLTTFPVNASGEREKLGWCTGCYGQRKKGSYVGFGSMNVERTPDDRWREPAALQDRLRMKRPRG